MESYNVSQEYLDKAIDASSKALVGMIMKRFELFDDKEVIKKEVKELVYENYRNLKGLISSFSSGVRFITKTQ
jgi:hypothetical protein